ncbi:MAG: hypothetical protein IPI93_06590 [Sphingobacteriaceae bacterium]|nr:hypothetical protein [Sphingobacteriaceae bacterium]
MITEKWYFKNGDNLNYAKKDFDDTNWDTINTALGEEAMLKYGFKGKAWFRLHLMFDSTVTSKSYVFQIYQKGSSEIYFNGKLVKAIGNGGVEKSMRMVRTTHFI